MTNDAVWRFASASVVGTSHSVNGNPCQDSHACRVFHDSRGDPILAVAVSDGAGSAKHSDLGSQLACAAVLEQAGIFFDSGGSVATLNVDLAVEWLNAIREWIAERAVADDNDLRDYACTILAAFIGENSAAFIQIGDGAIVVRDTPEDFCWVFWPERGEFANTTYFVTDASAKSSLRFEVGARKIDEIAIFTDGIEPLVLHYATKTVHGPFFRNVFPPVRASTATGADEELSAKLASYLSSAAINARTDDDKTLVLASRCHPGTVEATSEETSSASPEANA